jgi:hypothetical protein
MFMPVTRGGVNGAIEPAAMRTVDGAIVTFVTSLLTRLIVTPPVGAGADRVTGNAADWPGPTVILDGRMMVPGLTTLTVALVSAISGKALAWIVVSPSATLVTGTVTLEALPGKMTLDGTVATAGFKELKFMVSPTAGAGAERFSVRFCVAIPLIVRLMGKKLIVAVTLTVALAPV